MSSNALKLIIAVILFCVAAVLLVTLRGDEEVPRPPDDAKLDMVDFVCTGCGHHFQLSHEEAKKALAAAPKREAAGDSHGVRTRVASRRGLPKFIPCRKCGEAAALRAKRCDNDVYVPVLNPNGSKGECPG